MKWFHIKKPCYTRATVDASLYNQGSVTNAIWESDGKLFFTEIVGMVVIAEEGRLLVLAQPDTRCQDVKGLSQNILGFAENNFTQAAAASSDVQHVNLGVGGDNNNIKQL